MTLQPAKLVTVVIPTLNEDIGIRKTISKIPRKELADLGYDLEILVVDGNSSDSTQDSAKESGAKVIVEMNPGYGRAVRTGFAAAAGEIVAVCDGDGTYPTELLPKYLHYLDAKNLDFLTINRLSHREKNAMPLSHVIGNKVLSGWMNLIYSINVKDSQSGMYLARKRFIGLVNLRSNCYSLAQEIKIIAFKYFRSEELEGKYYAREGQTKLHTWKDGLKNLLYLFKFRLVLNDFLTLNKRLKKADKIPSNEYDLI